MTATDAWDLLGRLGLDLICLLVLVGWLYRRRLAAPEMALVFTALNMGLFAAVTVIGTGDFPTGVGFGLFGLLSLVRLRSAAFTLKDVSYTFVALVLALVNGLPGRPVAGVVALDVLLLAAIWVADESRQAPLTRVMRVTLDQALTDPDQIGALLRERLPGPPVSVVVDEVDWVRETTRVSVRQQLSDGWWQRRDAEIADEVSERLGEVRRDA